MRGFIQIESRFWIPITSIEDIALERGEEIDQIVLYRTNGKREETGKTQEEFEALLEAAR